MIVLRGWRIEREGGRGNTCFPVEEGLGKPRVSQEWDSEASPYPHHV